MSNYEVYADVEYITGHLRYGHFEGTISEELYKEYLSLETDKERSDFIADVCNLVVDDYSLYDYAPPTNIQIHESKIIKPKNS